MTIRVLYFAWLRERAGRAEETIALPPVVRTVGGLAAWLQARDAAGAAAFSDLAVIRAAVNQAFAPPDAPIADGDEVAFFPPVTGGLMATIRVQTGDFNIGAELAALTAGRGDIGGVGCFVGVVRDNPAHPLAALILEHYPGMTEQAMAAIAAEAEQRWDLLGCTLLHRVGRLPVGANIVLVLAAAPHRQSALDATAFLIDWLKTRAPFWKQEVFTDGAQHWVQARAGDDDAAARW